MQCNVCEFGCDITEISKGRCGTYIYVNEKVSQAPSLGYIGAYPISIETVPMLHFSPSAKFLQVFSKGCNFQCPGCVARSLAKGTYFDYPSIGTAKVIEKALNEQCAGVVSTLNEPAANYYLFRDLALKAKDEGLLVGCSTNCYYTPETLKEFGHLVDFVNVGVKGYSNRSYRICGAMSSEPVFRNITELHNMGVHIEASVVYSRGNEDDVLKVASTLSEISRSIPLQVMRFIPFGTAPMKLEPSIGKAESLCTNLRKHMNHVYLFNSPGTEMLHTFCPDCGKVLAEREFYGPMGSRLIKTWREYSCECGSVVPVRQDTIPQERFEESGFIGGYRISRAFGMVHAVVTCLGINNERKLMEVWKSLHSSDTLLNIHQMIQQPYPYLDFIRMIACIAEVPEKGEELIGFIRERLELVSMLSEENPGHRAYYCMGSPLFALNPGRMENNLVEFAGGISINKILQKEGKPGFNISVSYLNKQNPQSIFISGFLSRPLYEFSGLCRKYGIDVDALRRHSIYVVPPSWDFGNPRWILGLLFIADKFNPGRIDIWREADKFYERFYGISFREASPNRSFHRPTSGKWFVC
ncbi:MAG: radical SAM protein [Methanosarcinaceae archaeon]|nr:radical SAM protein [Methanosarcinaceae archaeon]